MITRRHPTVEALAADLRRHSTTRRALARPRSAGYVFTRFIRRHRSGWWCRDPGARGRCGAGNAGFKKVRAEVAAWREAQTAAHRRVHGRSIPGVRSVRGAQNSIIAHEISTAAPERIRAPSSLISPTQSNLMEYDRTVRHEARPVHRCPRTAGAPPIRRQTEIRSQVLEGL
jgi:hypothetical protein